MNDTPADATQERSPLELVAFAAWVNCPVDKIPEEYRAPTCPHTMASWKRVADAILATRTPSLAAQDGLVDALEKLLTAGVPRIWKSYRGDYCVSMMQKEYFGDTIPDAVQAALASIEQSHD